MTDISKDVMALPRSFLSQDAIQVFYRLLAALLICAVLAVLSDSFLSLGNILNVLRQASLTFFIASGMMFCAGMVSLLLVQEDFKPQPRGSKARSERPWRILATPVLLGLSTYRPSGGRGAPSDGSHFAAWVVDELVGKYGLPRPGVTRWPLPAG